MSITPYFYSMAISGGKSNVFLDGGNVVTSLDNGTNAAAPVSGFYTDPTTDQQTAIFSILIPVSSSNVLDQYDGSKQSNFTPEYKGYGFGLAQPTHDAANTQLQAVTAVIPAAEYPVSDLTPSDQEKLVVDFDIAQGFSMNDSMTEAQSASVTFAIYNNLTRRSCQFRFLSGASFANAEGRIPQNQLTNTGEITGLNGWGYDAVPQELRGGLHRPGYV